MEMECLNLKLKCKSSIVPYINGTYLACLRNKLYLLFDRPKKVDKQLKISSLYDYKVLHDVEKDHYYAFSIKSDGTKCMIKMNKEFAQYVPHIDVKNIFLDINKIPEAVLEPVLMAPEVIRYNIPPYIITKNFIYRTSLAPYCAKEPIKRDVLLRVSDESGIGYLMNHNGIPHFRLLTETPSAFKSYLGPLSIEELQPTEENFIFATHTTGYSEKGECFIDFIN